MLKKYKDFIYNSKEKRFRGSFITLITQSFLYGAYSLILFLVYYQVYIASVEKLSDLTSLLLGTFASISGVHAFSANSYFSNKSRQNRYAKGNKPKVTEEP